VIGADRRGPFHLKAASTFRCIARRVPVTLRLLSPARSELGQRLMGAGMDLPTVDHLAEVEPVLEQIGERPHSERPPPMIRPLESLRALLRMPCRARSSASARTEPSSR
jgi:hypothetical protein